ncbi:MAG: hypothetical protein ACK41T_07125 [Pseudobdellovibrio sp.]
MFKDEITMQFQGFHPTDFTRNLLNGTLTEIREEAPTGANVKGTFSRKDRMFKGIITIYSSAGKFFATATGKKLKDVQHKLMQQMRRQLNRWKSERFHRPNADELTQPSQSTEANTDFYKFNHHSA